MRFVEKYEPIVRTANDEVISLGLFDSYYDANDTAVKLAMQELPNETVKAYEIRKAYVNTAFMDA